MDLMTIGMVLDYLDEYIELEGTKGKKKSTVRKATQQDINAFFG